MKKFSTAIFGAMLFASNIYARPVNDVVYYVPDYKVGTGIYKGYINFNGVNSTPTTSSIENSAAPLTKFVNSLNAQYWSLRDSIDTKLAAKFAEYNGRLLNTGSLKGDLDISITGAPNGNMNISVGNLEYYQVAEVSKSNWLGRTTCTVGITLKSLNFQAEYNPSSGAFTNVKSNYQPVQDVSCDTSLSWIPIIGDWANNYAESQANNLIAQASSGLVINVVNIDPQKAIFGFASAIEPGRYMVGNNDAGTYITNNLKYLTNSKSIHVFSANYVKYEPLTTSPQPQADFNVTGNVFSVDFADGNSRVGFRIDSTKSYGWKKRVIKGTDGPGEE